MNLLAGAAKEIHRELAEPGREACTPVALSDTLLPKLISGELLMRKTGIVAS